MTTGGGKFNQIQEMKGFSSFEDDSLPDYSEFDSDSVTITYFKERLTIYTQPDECLSVLFQFVAHA